MGSQSQSRLALLGTIASLLGLLAAASVFWLSRLEARKALTVQVYSNYTWFPKALGSDFSLSYRGVPVENVASGLIAFKNTGRQPIARSDYDGPIRIALRGVSALVSARPAGCAPADLLPTVSAEGGELRIEPLLLNPGDFCYLEFTALCSASATVDVALSRARIAGIPRVDFVPVLKAQTPRRTITLNRALLSMFVGIAVSFLTSLLFSSSHELGPLLRRLTRR